jgi:hypothetical protein
MNRSLIEAAIKAREKGMRPILVSLWGAALLTKGERFLLDAMWKMPLRLLTICAERVLGQGRGRR